MTIDSHEQKEVVRSAISRARLALGHGTGALLELWRPVHNALAPYVAPLEFLKSPLYHFFRGTWWRRFISRTLLRRIVSANLVGLIVILVGLMYLSFFNTWLIDAKLDHLASQGRIAAAAIASKAIVTEQRLPNQQPGGSEYDAIRDNPFAKIEFSLPPEIVTPMLPALMDGTNNRARVYDAKGVLIADSSRFLNPDELGRTTKKKHRTKNFWTRLTQWLMRGNLPVYKEIGIANGRRYPEVAGALDGKSQALLQLTKGGEQIVSIAVPIQRAGSVRGVLLLSTPPGAIDDALAGERKAVAVFSLIAITAAILASVLLARTVARPMRQLSRSADAVTRDIRAVENLPKIEERDDEVGQLARSFQKMTHALYRRIEASERFAADVAHELKNPLAAARSTAESIQYAKDDQQRAELIEQVTLELKRLNRLISDVSNASRMNAELALQRFDPVDLKEAAENLTSTFADLHQQDGVNVVLEVETNANGDDFIVAGQDGRLQQVLTNLLSNAISFSSRGKAVTVRLHHDTTSIDLIVEDQGPGIPKDKLDTIFKRFYTYRPTAESSRGDNSGLGLAISREIVEAHGGKLWAENIGPAPDEGSTPRKTGRNGKSRRKRPKTGARFIARLPVRGSSATRRPSRGG